MLEKKKRGTKGDEEKAELVRQCGKCYGVTEPSAKICPYCGFEYPIVSRTPDEVEGDLKEITKVEKRHEQGRAQTLEELIAIGRKRGYKNPAFWARTVYNYRLAKNRG